MTIHFQHSNFYLSCFYLLLIVSNFLGCAEGASAKFSYGSCATLSDARLNNPCVGVVTYPFYLFQGQTQSSLRFKANSLLNNTFLLQDSAFATKYVRYVCSRLYLKCQPNIDLHNTSTYNYRTYGAYSIGYAVPFQRPCVSVCSTMLSSAPNLAKVLMGLSQNMCTKTFDYSFGDITAVIPMFFDTSNDATKCHVPSLSTVGSLVDVYAGGYCDGVLRQIVVPPANKLDASFSMLQPPGVTQSLYSQALESAVARLPVWISADCTQAMKQYLCYPVFPSPQTITAQTAIDYSGLPALAAYLNTAIPGVTQSTIVVPSYPARKYCEAYVSKCEAFIAAANGKPNCSVTFSGNTVVQFPVTRQTVTSFSTTFGTLKFPSDPNNNAYYNETEYGYYEPDCPPGYVIPENPDDENVQWIPGTGCANACRSRLWMTSEWTKALSGTFLVALIGAICAAINLLYLSVTKEVLNYYLVTFYTILNLVASCQSLYVAGITDFGAKFCHDNATNQMSVYSPGSPCVVQAIILSYAVLASCSAILTMTIQWAVELFGRKDISSSKWYFCLQFVLAVLLPAIPVIYNGVKDQFGFSKSVPLCFILTKPWAFSNEAFWTSGVPVFATYCLAYFIYFICSMVYLRSSSFTASPPVVTATAVIEDGKKDCAIADSPEQKKQGVAMHQNLWEKATCCIAHPYILVLFFSAILFIPYIIAHMQLLKQYGKMHDSYIDWTKCVFQQYNGESDSFVEKCGDHASVRPGPVLGVFQVIILTGNMMFITPAFIFSHVYCTYGGFLYLFKGRAAPVAGFQSIGDIEVVGNAEKKCDADQPPNITSASPVVKEPASVVDCGPTNATATVGIV